MNTEKYLPYRGDIQALEGCGHLLYLAVRHPEKQPMGLWAVDMDKLSLHQISLKCGVTALGAEKERIWAAGDDARIYTCTLKGKTEAIGPELSEPATALALLSQERLAVLAGKQVLILSCKKAAVVQQIDLAEKGLVLAAHESGNWFAVGDSAGVISVFECEDKAGFMLSESAQIHRGAVTALVFEPGEPRFVSAGTDQGFFLTPARGKLEPEDRARGGGHSDRVQALVSGPARFYSGGADKCLKAWPRPGNARPVTLKEGLGEVTALALVNIGQQLHIAAACKDNGIRCYPLDTEGKFGELSLRIRDAYALAEHESNDPDPGIREKSLRTLAEYGDKRSLAMIAERIQAESDPGLQKTAARLLGDSGLPFAVPLLEKILQHQAEAVRTEALSGLRKLCGAADLRPLLLAIGTGRADIGVIAVRALEESAVSNEQARLHLRKAADSDTFDIRHAALHSLEKTGPENAPDGNLDVLRSKHADIRRFALIRVFQRNFLDLFPVQSALRRMCEDADASVRKTAFLLTLSAKKNLADILRSRDADIHRQLFEMETCDVFQTAKKEKAPALPKIKAVKSAKLEPGDDAPLLQAMSSRSPDICLAGAQALAHLGDTRAFGLLLQLSREPDAGIRAAVCRSLALLADPGSIRLVRTFLNEDTAEVRDAAFSALTAVYAHQPLSAAREGLGSAHEDVRTRSLRLLSAEIRKAKDGIAENARDLLLQILNDSAPKLRSEAFKAVLNLKLGKTVQDSLRFVLNSRHPDIRRECLTEIMAREPAPWAGEILSVLMNDPDPALRKSALDYALERTKESDLSPLDMAQTSDFADIRMAALLQLISRKTKSAQERIARFLDDKDRAIRVRALDALIDLEDKESLQCALSSPHREIQAGAAAARARHGDSAALAPLLDIIRSEMPREKEEKSQWTASVEKALEGLAELGNPGCTDDLIPLLQNPLPSLRKAASYALARSCPQDREDLLESALKHNDPAVRAFAAFGLALCGRSSVKTAVFSAETIAVLSGSQLLAAALALDGESKKDTDTAIAQEDCLLSFLDSGNPAMERCALIAMMLREMAENKDHPARCLACLSARNPDIRLKAVSALSAFGDDAKFSAFVSDLVNEKSEDTRWQIPADAISDMANLLFFADSRIRGRCADMLWLLNEEKDQAWQQAWPVFSARYAKEMEICGKAGAKAVQRKAKVDPAYLAQICFGACVGLAREQSGKTEQKVSPHIIRIRQKAMRRILEMAKNSADYATAAQTVFLRCVSDPVQAIRVQALEHLQELGTSPAIAGAEALASGYTDMGVAGLKLLTAEQSAEAADSFIRDAMMSRTDGLETEAAQMRMTCIPKAKVAAEALEAASERLRIQAVYWLSEIQSQDKDAHAALVNALHSRFLPVRVRAALSLGTVKAPEAFDALCALLRETRTVKDSVLKDRQIIDALLQFGDKRAAAAFMDRVEDDPARNAAADLLLSGVGSFRNPVDSERLLQFMEKPEWKKHAFNALLMISGYDQPLEDPEEERTDRKWLEKQHPRNDEVLAKVLKQSLRLNDTTLILPLIPAARWSQSHAADSLLSELAAHPEPALRYAVLEALGWRMRKRAGSADALERALEHKDADTRFLAAEALAKAGNGRGLSILLAAVDLMADIRMRMRAVSALGELADERALEMVLKLAAEQGHALQESALEAIGHMRSSDRADQIFSLLEKHAKDKERHGLAQMSLKGLRWFDTPKGWDLIRECAADRNRPVRETAIDLLGYKDDPANRDLLLGIIRMDDNYAAVLCAITAARRICGPEDYAPDYAILQSQWPALDKDALKRVCMSGKEVEILTVLTRCQPHVQKALETALLQRDPLPVEAAAHTIGSLFPETVRVGARIMGFAGKLSEKHADALASAFAHWHEEWKKTRQNFIQRGMEDESVEQPVFTCLKTLLWAGKKAGMSLEMLLSAARSWPDESLYTTMRCENLAAMQSFAKDRNVKDFLRENLSDPDSAVRTAAAEVLFSSQPETGDILREIEEYILSDRSLFRKIAAYTDIQNLLPQSAKDMHRQGLVLPRMLQSGETENVFQIAMNAQLTENVRLGAIETLARMADVSAEKHLAGIGASEATEEELRKAAWRGLRRSKRARIKAAG